MVDKADGLKQSMPGTPREWVERLVSSDDVTDDLVANPPSSNGSAGPDLIAPAPDGVSPEITLDVSSLPAGDLRVVYKMRNTISVETPGRLRLNNSSAYVHAWHEVSNSGVVTTGGNGAGDTYITGLGTIPGSSKEAGRHLQGEFVIQNYKDSTVKKVARGSDYGNTMKRWSGRKSTDNAAITTLQLSIAGAGNLATTCEFLVYVVPRS